MPSDRTVVTELATALGMLPYDDVKEALRARDPVLRIDDSRWDQLGSLYFGGSFQSEFDRAFSNGKFFAQAKDGLDGRIPHVIDWTGGRRATGDEAAPIDLCIDHVYLISCKYRSDVLANASPARLFDGLLAKSGTWERRDWYEAIASDSYQELYELCKEAVGLLTLPQSVGTLHSTHRKALRESLKSRDYPKGVQDAYVRFAHKVSEASATRWEKSLLSIPHETMVWRLLRIGDAPYFLLGSDGDVDLRLRIDSPWAWSQRFKLETFIVASTLAKQPRLDWVANYRPLDSKEQGSVRGHVEVRWSHGRFAQPPEAKIYLDSAIDQVPGYHVLTSTRCERDAKDFFANVDCNNQSYGKSGHGGCQRKDSVGQVTFEGF